MRRKVRIEGADKVIDLVAQGGKLAVSVHGVSASGTRERLTIAAVPQSSRFDRTGTKLSARSPPSLMTVNAQKLRARAGQDAAHLSGDLEILACTDHNCAHRSSRA